MTVKKWMAITAATAGFMLGAPSTSALTLDFSNLPGAVIRFPGGNTFQFAEDSNGYDFAITDPGPSLGLQGNITGTFTIVGPPGGTTRPVTGNGSFSIEDAGGLALTADLQWIDILAVGALGGLNVTGVVNLTNMQYAGANADLQAMVAGGNMLGIVTLSFQDAGIQSLDNLRNPAGGVFETSYSGSVTAPVPDGGATILLMAAGLLGIGLSSRRFSAAS